MNQRGTEGDGGVSYRRALRRPEFAALYVARVLSDWGDQLARVSIAALVLHQSRSALFAATAFAVSFLPQVFGQALLGPLSDWLPRRMVMIYCDVLRFAGLVLLVAVVGRGAPVWVLLGLLFLVELAGAPFFASSRALLAEIFTDRPLFLRANSLLQMSFQVNQVAGVAIGGIVVAAFGTQQALWIDALTFGVSALLIVAFVASRPAAHARTGVGLRGWMAEVSKGVAFLRKDVATRSLMIVAWVTLLAFIAPEAVALPYAQVHGASTAAGGVLLAASPFGAVISVLVVSRWSPSVQVGRILPMALLLPLPLLGLVFNPAWVVAVVLFVLAGVFQGFMVPLMSTFTLLSPDQMRGRLSALAGSGFALIAAGCWLAVGALADLTSPSLAVTVSAALTLLALVPVWRTWPRRELAEASARAYS
ncbi:MFS transporter [Angustibacter sp. McL0619]|uniref:MFS transporter n=1 Tax=Angustibacter sp. McL0619 TaxID=3415676 RepID=UPI003CE73898